MPVTKAGTSKVHARWWNDPQLGEMPWLQSLSSPDLVWGPLYDAAWPTFLNLFGDQVPATVREVGARLFGNFKDIARLYGEAPTTLCHGDFRLDNMFFEVGEDTPFALFDWQLTMRGSGPLDIAYFLGASLPVEQRRQLEEMLLRRYHDALQEGGVRDYSWDALQRDYRIGMAWVANIIVVATANLDVSMPRGQAIVAAYFERGDAALADAKLLELLAE